MALIALAQREFECPKYLSHTPSLAYKGSSRLLSSLYKSKNCCPFRSKAWKVIFHGNRISLHLLFLLKSQDDLHRYWGRGLNNLNQVVDHFMQQPIVLAWALPELDWIAMILDKESPELLQDRVNLEQMMWNVKNSSCRVDWICDDYDLWNSLNICGLVDITSDSK